MVRSIEEREAVELDLLIEGVRLVYGYDLRHYDRASVRRRVASYMQANELKSITGLLERILHDSAEMKAFLGSLLVSVTSMFRDPALFLAFRQKVVPLLHTYPSVRIWHAGCSTGEEVYSMAILLEEEGLYDKAHLYATDLNEESLAKARTATYPLRKMGDYSRLYRQAGGTGQLSDYYRVSGESVTFLPELTRNLVFFEHNLATDYSFNEFHVIVCRNVLIYFNPELQGRVHDLFYDSLAVLGFLILGDRESLYAAKREEQYRQWVGDEKLYRKIR